MPCTACRNDSLVRDDVTGDLVCSDCGFLQAFDNYQAQLYGLDGPQGTNIRHGSIGTGSVLNYKDKKIFEAQKIIDHLMLQFGLTGSKCEEIRNMISKITDGEFGLGNWFPIFVGACTYVVMRSDDKVMPMAEIAAAVGCDEHELGRMVNRVVEHLGVKLPEFDYVESFLRLVKNLSVLDRLDRDKMERIKRQGIFLLNCSIIWFLSTGRRPLPLVVAVLVFVAELNGVKLGIEEVVKYVHVAVVTCRKRYKELLEKLVKVAHQMDLPWGKDVTVKNIVKHAPIVISYMEARSMKEHCNDHNELDPNEFDLQDVLRECLSKDVGYWSNDHRVESESRYFDVGDENAVTTSTNHDLEQSRISPESLSLIYKKFANEVDSGKFTGEYGSVDGRRESFDLRACRDWWNGQSKLSKKLLLKQIIESDVGLDALPPSYIKGCMVLERRRERIKVAKIRINNIMHPSDTDNSNFGALSSINAGKKRKRAVASEIGWEDLIIEILLLHKVKEEEIEKGHYNVLLDLHVSIDGMLDVLEH
ncbi:plant-specific TFIIB-related protein PTF2 [Carica papaya]|uniref:plant-specific TFIIB-related protein PTF2 n=1 Tax=Carica papaya TaxID=3649 RepID=UPI000B8CF77A|nr:plant-specific TFIIB-related protein PTF2 [Carica papaya]XP_021907771.1 plant-specific TFIIB-related protein PTF2 [Carica papaya]